MPGTIPTKFIIPYKDDSISSSTTGTSEQTKTKEYDSDKINSINNIFSINNFTFESPPFPWARSEPYIYVQQIILRSTIAPWISDLILTDAFRAPLYEAFNLVEFIRNHEEEENKRTLGHICLHVENVKRGSKELLFPEYNCLVLSPINFWQQNLQIFNKDVNLLNTIFHYQVCIFNLNFKVIYIIIHYNILFYFQNLQKTKVSIAEMLLGMKVRDTGFKRYPIRVRPRIIQYAVTLVLRENDRAFLSSLKQQLIDKYSLHQKQHTTPSSAAPVTHQQNTNSYNSHSLYDGPASSTMYIFYPGEFNLMELIPISIAFVSLFIYVYFSFRKIDVIRSRIILALSSVATVLSSLFMSIGFCFFFGLTISIQFKGIYPLLIIIVGLENVLVITKSVVSIDATLDLKIRLAKGLSKEGWSITKNLLTEITILTIGLGTLVPVIQEFCIFAIVGLISDFFIQMFFFSTMLAFNIEPEFSSEVKSMPKSSSPHQNGMFRTKNLMRYPSSSYTTPSISSSPIAGMNRSRSHPKLSNLEFHQSQSTNVVATPVTNVTDRKIPKRVRLFNFWARTRFFQRAFMIWMLAWISTIVYNAGIIEHFFEFGKTYINATNQTSDLLNQNRIDVVSNLSEFDINSHDDILNSDINFEKHIKDLSPESYLNFTEQVNKLKHSDYETTHHLSSFHWASILKQYNISLSGKYVVVLPSIKLSQVIGPEIALNVRNPGETSIQHNFQWKALAVALDPIDFSDSDYQQPTDNTTPLFPKSPIEIFLILILCSISLFFLSYLLVVLYRCICSRNYAEWRASWSFTEEVSKPRTQQVLTCVTLQLKGHTHSIDCMAIDGTMIATTCLEGRIKIWDATSGELMADIVRNKSPTIDVNEKPAPPIWCLDYLDNLIVIGCADGRLEFWEGTTQKFKCVYKSETSFNDGVTHVKLVSDKVVAARLSGRVDILRLGTYNRGVPIDYNFSSVYRRSEYYLLFFIF